MTKTIPPSAHAAAATSPSGAATSAPSSSRKTKRKRKSPVDTAKQYRATHFPAIKDEDVWDRGRGGWASVPRPIGLIANVVIKEAHKSKYQTSSAAGTTYITVWLHYQGHGMARIESEADAALESGYGGERGITTFRRHMRALKELGFIDFVEESRGRVKWVLLHNPYQVVKQLYADGQIDKTTYSTMFERADAIGVGDEFDDEEVAADGSE